MVIKYHEIFYGNKISCLSVILLDSVVNVDKKYYPQTFSEECKYTAK